jgi:L-threonylcarbamoyladenylate synthase
LAERFWPGPLTLVVPVSGEALEGVATERGVGFRCSPHPTASALVEQTGRPVVSTSCNRTGDEPCRTAGDVAERFGDSLPVVGGEPTEGQPPSTVVAVSVDGQIEVLREGSISRSALDEARA